MICLKGRCGLKYWPLTYRGSTLQVIDRSLMPSQYWPGLYALFGMDYERLEKVYPLFYDRKPSEKAFEEFMTERAGLGLAVQQPELVPVEFDAPNEGYRTQVTHASYGLAVAISREAKDDNQYEDVGSRMMKELTFSARQTEEYIAHAPLQVAGDTVNGLRADGFPLISPSHPTVAGAQGNMLISANVSELAFENAVIQISYARNGRGFIIDLKPRRVILSPESGPETRRILGSPLQWNAQTNNINVLRSTNALPEVIETPYLVDKDNYFIQTSEQDKDNGQGMTFWERTSLEVREDSNWSNQASLIAMYFRCSASVVDWRTIFASLGADGV
jgi:hypothetical protein